MTAPIPSVKGWCPGALQPMRSGDGLVVRLRLRRPILPVALARAIADLARTHGNGQIDLSQRANLQIRGVSDASWHDLIGQLAALDLLDDNALVEAVRNIIVSPLAGRDPTARIDALAASENLQLAISRDPHFRRLPGKFGFVIDDGGSLPLDGIDTDVRFLGVDDGIAVEIGDSWRIGVIAPDDIGTAAARVVAAFLAMRGVSSDAPRRMRALIARVGVAAVAQEAGFDLAAVTQRQPRPDAAIIGPNASGFLGLGVTFGRLTADQLDKLADGATRFGAGDICLTPWRAVLLPGADAAPTRDLTAAGFILSPADPRLAVTACPGAPECESAAAPVRADALALGALAAKLPGTGVRLHVSACPKGCARPHQTAVTLIARENGYDLVTNGRASTDPISTGLTRSDIESVLRTLGSVTPLNDRAAQGRDYIRDGAEIYRHSFAIIRREADLARFTPSEEKVAVRIIHASGMVEIASALAFADRAADAARTALKAGAPIFADAEMVARGVTRSRLPADNDVICTLTDPRVPGMAASIGTTRSAAAMELWRDRLAGSIVAIGNAPTALFRLLEMLDEGAGLPACVIGMPVGFVGAAESKDALMLDGRVPYIIVRGRRGGSAMAAAAVNALASERE